MGVCYFLVSQISRHCDAQVVSVGSDGACVALESKEWGGDVMIHEDTKEIYYPVTMPERDLLVIWGAAQLHGYTVTEYFDDEFSALLNSNEGNVSGE